MTWTTSSWSSTPWPGDPDLTRQVHSLARRRKILVNSFDQPLYSDFGMVALVDPGHLRVGISTSNASPSLSSRLRQDLETLFDDEFVAYLDQLARLRSHLRSREPDPRKRAAFAAIRGSGIPPRSPPPIS